MEYKHKGVVLRTHRKSEFSIITTHGKISYLRYTLIPQGENGKENLFKLCGSKAIAPLDCYLGMAGLPFKITPSAMLKIAYWAQNQGSFERTENAISEVLNVNVSNETIRSVANFVGNVIFKNDCKKAEEAYSMLNYGQFHSPNDKKGILYIQADGRTNAPIYYQYMIG